MNDAKLIQIVKSFRYGIIGRKDSDYQCFVVSAPLKGYLAYKHGIKAKLIDGAVRVQTKPGRFLEAPHCWLELEDGRILDATYDQFGEDRPKVFLGEMPSQYIKGGLEG